MKFFSNLIAEVKSVTDRFPVLSIIVALNFLISIFTIRISKDVFDENAWLIKLLLVAMLGISLIFAITIIIEKYKLIKQKQLILYASAFLLLIGYYFLFSNIEAKYMVRFGIYAAALHLLCAIAPFLSLKSEYGFWRYNQALFVRFFQSILFSSVLYAGLLLAIFAIRYLFKVELIHNIEAYTLSFCFILFNTFFFLSGVPNDWEEIEREITFPNILKVFAQYLLVPLSTLYTAILYAYGVKILIDWQLPDGFLSMWVILNLVVGILAMLFVHPLREMAENTWIKLYTRYFYILIIPLNFMMAVGLWRRISEYGITEARYFGMALFVWILFIAILNISSRKGNIKIIPLSLIFALILTSFGPWGAFSVSENSQTERYIEMLKKHKIIENQKLSKSIDMNREDYNNFESIHSYLFNFHNSKSLILWLDENTDLADSTITKLKAERKSYNDVRFDISNIFTNIKIKDEGILDLGFSISKFKYKVDVQGFDIMISSFNSENFMNPDDNRIIQKSINTFICQDTEYGELLFDFKAAKEYIISYQNQREIDKKNKVDTERLSVYSENEKATAKFIIEELHYNRKSDSSFSYINGTMLIKRK